MFEPLKISVITPSYNHARFIRDTLDSVKNQQYPNVEHIVIDGDSNDGTRTIVQQYPHVKFISEKDSGQSDAINKGFSYATGDILCWLNSDDYFDEDTLMTVAEIFQNEPNCMCLYGDITYVDIEKNYIKKESGAAFSLEALLAKPDLVRQPSTFWRKRVMEEIGVLEPSLHLVMDYDLFLRMSQRFQWRYINKNLSFFRTYDTNKTSSRNRQQALELLSVWKKRTGSITALQYLFFLFRYFNVHRFPLFPLFYKAWKGIVHFYGK